LQQQEPEKQPEPQEKEIDYNTEDNCTIIHHPHQSKIELKDEKVYQEAAEKKAAH